MNDQDRYAQWLAANAPRTQEPPPAPWLGAFLERAHDGVVDTARPVGRDAGPLTAALLLRFVVVDDDRVRLTSRGFRALTRHTVDQAIRRTR